MPYGAGSRLSRAIIACIDSSAFHEFERAGWQRAAEHYAGAFGALTRQTIGQLLEAAHVAPHTRLLDVASGPGYVAADAVGRGASAVGIDFSSAMVSLARRIHPGIAFVQADAERLPFADRSFDAVAMNFGMLHLARPDAALAEGHRVLRHGGRYAFSVWARPEEAIGFGIVLRAIEAHGTPDVGLPAGPPFFQFSDPAECGRSLARAGFAHAEVRQVPLMWTMPSAGALFDAVSQGGVRTAATLRAQTPEALCAIRGAVERAALQYDRGGTLDVPMSAIVASGVKR